MIYYFDKEVYAKLPVCSSTRKLRLKCRRGTDFHIQKKYPCKLRHTIRRHFEIIILPSPTIFTNSGNNPQIFYQRCWFLTWRYFIFKPTPSLLNKVVLFDFIFKSDSRCACEFNIDIPFPRSFKKSLLKRKFEVS